MHAGFNRRTATKVKDGRVQRKNRHRPTGHDGYVLDRESPGRGFRHVLSKRDVQAFIDSIGKNQPMPLTSFDTAFESHRVVFAADLSAQEGRPVKMSELRK